MIAAYRIFKPRHAASAFTGEGARLYGGRFNTKGTAVVYTGGSVALAAFEMLVHLDSHGVLETYQMCRVEFDESLVLDLDPKHLPSDWRQDPVPASTQMLGDDWVTAGSSAVLRVPSAVVPQDSNYLLNPAHPDFARIVIHAAAKFTYDPRVLKK